MKLKATIIHIVCDGCGEVYDDSTAGSANVTTQRREAARYGWVHCHTPKRDASGRIPANSKMKDYCPKCHADKVK